MKYSDFPWMPSRGRGWCAQVCVLTRREKGCDVSTGLALNVGETGGKRHSDISVGRSEPRGGHGEDGRRTLVRAQGPHCAAKGAQTPALESSFPVPQLPSTLQLEPLPCIFSSKGQERKIIALDSEQ